MIIRPIIRPLILPPSGPPPSGDPFTAVGTAGSSQFNDGADDWLAYWWEYGEGTKTFTLTQAIRIYWEIIAGGGPGGNTDLSSTRGGAGGAGGRKLGDVTLDPGTYTVVVGNGGIGATTVGGGKQLNGEDSRILQGESLVDEAIGGGAGGAHTTGSENQRGENGGSGGSAWVANTARNAGTGISGQGNNAGGQFLSATTSERASGGGGGAAGVGGNATINTRGVGGAGVTSLFTGSSVTVCVGGNGCDATNVTTDAAVGFGSGGHGRSNTIGVSLNGNPGRIAIRFNPL